MKKKSDYTPMKSASPKLLELYRKVVELLYSGSPGPGGMSSQAQSRYQSSPSMQAAFPMEQPWEGFPDQTPTFWSYSQNDARMAHLLRAYLERMRSIRSMEQLSGQPTVEQGMESLNQFGMPR